MPSRSRPVQFPLEETPEIVARNLASGSAGHRSGSGVAVSVAALGSGGSGGGSSYVHLNAAGGVPVRLAPSEYIIEQTEVNIPAETFAAMVAAINRSYERVVSSGQTSERDPDLTVERLIEAQQLIQRIEGHRQPGQPVRVMVQQNLPDPVLPPLMTGAETAYNQSVVDTSIRPPRRRPLMFSDQEPEDL